LWGLDYIEGIRKMIYLVEHQEIEAEDEKQAAEFYVQKNYNMQSYEQMKVMVNGKPFTVFTYPIIKKRR
jgi:hypothetical protein